MCLDCTHFSLIHHIHYHHIYWYVDLFCLFCRNFHHVVSAQFFCWNIWLSNLEYERNRCRLFQKRGMRYKLDICFICKYFYRHQKNYISIHDLNCLGYQNIIFTYGNSIYKGWVSDINLVLHHVCINVVTNLLWLCTLI